MKCAGCGKVLTPKGIAAGECTCCHNFVPTKAEEQAEHAEHIKRLERRIADRPGVEVGFRAERPFRGER